MRTWGFLDAGFIQTNGGYSNSVDGAGDKDGTVFQYYDPNTGHAVINNGSNGLVQLDYAIWRASVSHLKLVIPFTNYWYGMGGVPQYLTWFNVSNVNDDTVKEVFFTNATFEQLYMNYVGAILNRVNVYSGIQYKNDPTIMAWELMNKPRYPGGVTAPQFAAWVTTMSQFIKSIDSNHLVSVGDEGFGIGNAGTYGPPVNSSDPNYWNYYYPWGNWEGYNWTQLLQISTIDYGSVHLYPDWWTWWLSSDTRTAQIGIDYGNKWITDHAQISQQIGKPMVLGEFGWQNRSTRDAVFGAWLHTIEKLNVAQRHVYWMLAGSEVQSSSNGTAIVPYPDYDGFTVYWDASSATHSTALLIQQHAINMELKSFSLVHCK